MVYLQGSRTIKRTELNESAPPLQSKAKKQHPLFDLFLHSSHSLRLRVLEPVGGAAEVTQHVVTLVMEEDVLHLQVGEG